MSRWRLPSGKIVSCDLERIEYPEAVQAFASLLALHPDTLQVLRASANVAEITGISLDHLFSLTSFLDMLSLEHRFKFSNHVYRLRGLPYISTPDVFQLQINTDQRGTVNFNCAIHFSNGFLIVELASDVVPGEADHFGILVEYLAKERTGDDRRETRARSPSEAEYVNFTPTTSEILSALVAIEEYLLFAETMDELFDRILRVLEKITGYGRIKIYQFTADGCGEVIYEKKRVESMASYLGNCFPPTDVPPQARRLYKINKVYLSAFYC